MKRDHDDDGSGAINKLRRNKIWRSADAAASIIDNHYNIISFADNDTAIIGSTTTTTIAMTKDIGNKRNRLGCSRLSSSLSI